MKKEEEEEEEAYNFRKIIYASNTLFKSPLYNLKI